MIFTWDTNNLCIIFKWWRIYSTASLLFSLLGVVILTAGYELVREMSRRYESRDATVGSKTRSSFDGGSRLDAGMETPQDDAESSSLLWAGRGGQSSARQSKIVKALFYAVQVFYSFFIMCVLAFVTAAALGKRLTNLYVQASFHDLQWVGHVSGGCRCVCGVFGIWQCERYEISSLSLVSSMRLSPDALDIKHLGFHLHTM